MSSPKVETDVARLQQSQTNEAAPPKPGEVAHFRAALAAGVADGLVADEGDPVPSDGENLDDGSARPRATTAALRAHAGLAASADVPTARPVVAKKRVGLGTHLARQSAMQPLADLLSLVRQRAAGQAVPDLRIVPPQPNPLRLTLHLAMDGNEFVVKARTALGADRRAEVQQALHVLEAALTARLRMPARVVLLA